jgi:acyl carrier protein
MERSERNIYHIIRKVGYRRGVITKQSSLVRDFGFDSLDILQMVNMMEFKFNMNIQDRDIPRFRTVQSLVEYVSNHKNINLN